jgi:osmotically inducible lipoprotein OsmB
MKKLFIAVVAAFATLALGACETTRNPTGQEVGTVGGAVVGGALGSAVTGGSTVGTIGGAIAGGAIGNEAGDRYDERKGRR